MFKQIMVPVDLAHVDQLEKSLRVAADISNLYGIPVCYVGVANEQPGSVSHDPEEFQQKLDRFAHQQVLQYGHEAKTRTFVSHDLVADLDDVLLAAAKELNVDLVVMASHIPTLVNYVWPTNGGKIAAHSKAAVFVVR